MRDLSLTTSFWFSSTFEAVVPLEGTQFADVAIVGCGCAGLSAARHPPTFTYSAFRKVCLAQAAAIRDLLTTRRVQTNEVGG